MKLTTYFGALLLTMTTAALAASDEAGVRYAADKKLCAEESSSSLRMQCLRDARAEYERALAAAKAEAVADTPPARATSPSSCPDCGKVTGVRVVEREGKGSALGIIGGGVAGALLGNQIGGGSGKDLATIAGAAGGAYAGHTIEGKMNTTKVWSVQVRLNNGQQRRFEFGHDPGFAAGDPVRVDGGRLLRR